ncbi:MAG: ABC transporter permease [Candidatus Saccharicenans sp.]|jgi:phospholipid/cholesterol/gamma-HCH transport system permease protein|nr:ABC transporter permease [Candidatus Saccharicenans sp.]MDH7574944.1 ABC transporter permease [Candidatus Saccharicenans sp.]
MDKPIQIPFFSAFFCELGQVYDLAVKGFRAIFQRPFEKRNFWQQLEEVGVNSLPVVSLTAAFGGLVFGLQAYLAFHRYIGPGSESQGGPIIAVGLCRELIPILVGLMVAGRVGSAMAAEIGTMKITEQIDALFSLGANPVKYLVAPRILASMIMVPCLTLYGDVIGIFGGYTYNVLLMKVNKTLYVQNTLKYFEMWDISVGLIKALVFGLVIAIIGCWQGMTAEGGAEGVGRATTKSVVVASITILILNFFLSKILPATL